MGLGFCLFIRSGSSKEEQSVHHSFTVREYEFPEEGREGTTSAPRTFAPSRIHHRPWCCFRAEKQFPHGTRVVTNERFYLRVTQVTLVIETPAKDALLEPCHITLT